MFLKFYLNWISCFSFSLSFSHSLRSSRPWNVYFPTIPWVIVVRGGGPVGLTVSRTVVAIGGSLFGRWVALSKPRASSSHLDSECWTRENLGRRTDTPRIRKASVLTHANRTVCISPVPCVRACECAYERMDVLRTVGDFQTGELWFDCENFRWILATVRIYRIYRYFSSQIIRDIRMKRDVRSLATCIKSKPSRLINYYGLIIEMD